MKKGKKGFTLVEIMIVVAIIGLLAAIAIPSFMRARTSSQRNACINNMRQIEAGKDQFALETGRTNLWDWEGFEFPAGTAAVKGTGGGAAFSALCDPTQGFIRMFPLCPSSTSAHYTAAISAVDYDINPIGSNAICNALNSVEGHSLAGTH